MKCCLKEYLLPLYKRFDPSRIDRNALAAQAAALRTQAGELLAHANHFAAYSMEKARGFSMLDFAFLKVCLLSVGIWMGSQFSRFFRRFRIVVFLGFVVSYIYLIWRLFLRDE